jgi:hypothetical protein
MRIKAIPWNNTENNSDPPCQIKAFSRWWVRQLNRPGRVIVTLDRKGLVKREKEVMAFE